jgi:hypothetical protein
LKLSITDIEVIAGSKYKVIKNMKESGWVNDEGVIDIRTKADLDRFLNKYYFMLSSGTIVEKIFGGHIPGRDQW